MTELAHGFDDGEANQRFMGCWSSAVATPFLHWLGAAPAQAWLDIGCGTGAFTLVGHWILTRQPQGTTMSSASY
jgi:SAM-dependent methyltransferase